MHSAIEHAQQYLSVYVPHDWINIMKSARRKRPYVVQELSHKDFFNMKELAQHILRNRRVDKADQTVNWLEIRCLRVEKERPGDLLYKTDFDREFGVLCQSLSQVPDEESLQLAYSRPIPITKAKKHDLLALCTAKVIPEAYHQFFKSLPCETVTEDLHVNDEIDGSDAIPVYDSVVGNGDVEIEAEHSQTSRKRRRVDVEATLTRCIKYFNSCALHLILLIL